MIPLATSYCSWAIVNVRHVQIPPADKRVCPGAPIKKLHREYYIEVTSTRIPPTTRCPGAPVKRYGGYIKRTGHINKVLKY